ncbi:dynein heavy chain family protein family [Trichomonas vaginalis G3]|uniref:dynein heavy chain family protein family n=1 Tax=Trichomonas vaginalis (strain ATCC PRA-98 / G3) TaxID=412133 RepID=UPI0021E5CC9E|nr:dynein heavy chain family protein family [Trichomonas vaginalis G3]KAI5486860.1 dynein heavy chain family protein family [Trichomonas vaginalis G3]
MSLNPNRRKSKYADDDPEMNVYNTKKVHVGSTLGRSNLTAPRLFEPSDIVSAAKNFDTSTSRSQQTNKLATLQNPALLAFRNRAARNQNREVTSTVQLSTKMPPQHNASLLFPKPKTLKIPTSTTLEELRAIEKAEKESLEFEDDPIAYFSKRKDGRGHRFIYMIPTTQPNSPDYDPYTLQKVPAIPEEVTSYFTMSASGITHVQKNGDTDNVTLDQWSFETSIFGVVKKIRFFSTYFYWKPFLIWKNFMMSHRFDHKSQAIRQHPFFYEPQFFSVETALYMMRNQAEIMVNQNLLCFVQSRKYSIAEFEEIMKKNLDQLNNDYANYINVIIEKILDLYRNISDPLNVQVDDNEFTDIHNRNPNLDKLKLLEKKKARLRLERTVKVNNEIVKLSSFIRVIDYIHMETLTKACIEAFKEANENVSNVHAAIFQVDVYFGENGTVSLKPTLESLLKTVTTSLQDAEKTLNSLPRLISSNKLIPFIREGGFDISKFYEHGCTLSQILSGVASLEPIEKHIIEVLTESYRQAITSSQNFTDYYPIYKLGKEWNPRKYLITRKGEPYTGPISALERLDNEDKFLINNEDEPVVDLKLVANDINYFKAQSALIATMRTGLVKLALYVDSKELKKELEPIPEKALSDLLKLLKDLSQMKIDMIINAIGFYNREMKSDPHTLEQFVDYCLTLTRSLSVMDQIQTEITFVDSLYDLFDTFGVEHDRNPLPAAFASFKIDENGRNLVKENVKDPFVKQLKENVHKLEKIIGHLFEKATTIPIALKDVDIESKLEESHKLKAQVVDMEPQIKMLVGYQEAINVQLNDFSAYKNVLAATEFTISLYQIAKDWTNLSEIITKTHFSNINIEKFRTAVLNLQSTAKYLQENSRGNYPLLLELSGKIQDVLRYIDEVEHLSTGNMQARHWNALFDECGKGNAYRPDITLGELISLGILDNYDRIKRITETSRGESDLENRFQSINSYWSKVQLPLVETQSKNDDNVLIADVSGLITEINDAIITLQKMLMLPYVGGVREQVQTLSVNLENIVNILEQWVRFQNNWVLLLNLFASEEARAILPHQANRFASVQRKWVSMARHTSKDSRLFAVASFPSLLETLKENNQAIESILIALGKFLDSKRNAFPRLFFLSNKDVLTLVSTNSYSDFCDAMTKLFMNVINIIVPHGESDDIGQGGYTRGQPKIRINGLLNSDSDEFVFPHQITCSGQIETWLPQVMDAMKKSVITGISHALESLPSLPFFNWVLSFTSYTTVQALHVYICQRIDNCFSKIDDDPKVFQVLESEIVDKIKELSASLLSEVVPLNYRKISIAISVLQSFKLTVSYLGEKLPNTSHLLNWNQFVHLNFNQNNSQFTVQIDRTTYEHGLEYWGSVREYIQSATFSTAMRTITANMVNKEINVIIGSSGSGKTSLIRQLAMQFGKFLFTQRQFPDLNEFFYSRILIGAASSGSWLHITDADTLSHINSSYLFDNLRSLISAQQAGNPRITISSRLVDLDKNTRVFLSADPNFTDNEKVPAQLKALCRVVALRKPSYTTLAEIRLSALGVLVPKDIAASLCSFILLATTMFKERLVQQSIQPHLFAIFDEIESRKSVEFHSNQVLFVASYSYYHFEDLLDKSEKKILADLLFSSFKLGDNTEEMLQMIKDLMKSDVEKKFREVAMEEVKKFGDKVPSEYMIDQAWNLYNMFCSFNCVVIAGPPHSGKTTLLNLYLQIMNNEKMQTKTKLPYISATCYYGADKWKRIFGTIVNDLTLGQMWNYGQLHNTLYRLHSKKDAVKILKFDGNLTDEFAQYITQFIGPCDNKMTQMDSLEGYRLSNKFKVVVETDSLKNLSPSLLSKTRLLIMRNQQSDASINLKSPVCHILHPTLPFTRALEMTKMKLSETEIQSLRSAFCEVAPKFIEKISHTKNFAYYMESDSNMENGDIIITDVVPQNAAAILFQMVDKSKIDTNEVSQVTQLTAIAFFNAYSGIIHTSMLSHMDSWTRQTFNIDCPIDWSTFEIPDDFMKIFPKPSLQSMRYYKGKLIQMDTEILNNPPMIVNRYDKTSLQSTDAVIVTNSQSLPQLYTASCLVANGDHMMIIGDPASGKSSFVQMLYRDDDNNIVVPVPHSTLDQESFIKFISSHTYAIAPLTHTVNNQKRYILLFEDVDDYEPHVLELIRVLIQDQKLDNFSPSDLKIYENIPVKNFTIVCTVTNPRKLPIRFISLFAQVQMTPILPATAEEIARKALNFVGYADSMARSLVHLATITISTNRVKTVAGDLMQILAPFWMLEDKADPEQLGNLLVTQIIDTVFNDYSTEELQTELGEINSKDLKFPNLQEIINGTHISSIETKRFDGKKPPIVSFNITKIEENMKELMFHLSVFNSSSTQKIYIQFTANVIRSYQLIHNILALPGSNLILKGQHASGRFLLSRIAANNLECDFVMLGTQTAEEELDVEEQTKSYVQLMHDIITNAVLYHKVTVVFARYKQTNEEQIRQTMMLATQGDFYNFFNEEGIDNLYTRVNGSKPATPGEKCVLYWRIKKIVRANVHMIISCEEDVPYANHGFSHLNISPPGDNFFKSLATDLLNIDQIKEVVGNNINALAEIIPSFESIAKQNMSYYHPNSFYEFIHLLANTITEDVNNARLQSQAMQASIEACKILEKDLEETSKKITEMEPSVVTTNYNADTAQQAYTTRKDAIDARKAKLEEEFKTKTQSVKKNQERVQGKKSEYDLTYPRIESNRKVIESLTENDIETIRISAADPIPPLKLLLEIVCIIADMELDYETNGKPLLMHGTFVAKLLENISPSDGIPEEKLAKIDAYFENPEFSLRDLESVSPVLRIICDWIDCIRRSTYLSKQLAEDTAKLEQEENELKTMTEEMKLEGQSIKQVEEQLVEELQNLNKLKEEREVLKEAFKKIEIRKEKLSKFMENSNTLIERWKQHVMNEENIVSETIGDSILASFYTVFCGAMDVTVRQTLMKKVADEIKKNKIMMSENDPMRLISRRFTLSRGQDVIKRVTTFMIPALVDVVHLLSTDRTPLLIDPDHIVYHLLTVVLKPKRFVVMSQNCLGLESILAQAVCDGKTVILLDADYLNPIVEPLLQLGQVFLDTSASRDIKVGSKMATFDPRFRLILVSTVSSVSNLPEDLLSRVNLVNVTSSSVDSVYQSLTSVFVEFFAPDVIPIWNEKNKNYIEHEIKIKDHENDIIEILSEFYRNLQDDESYDPLSDESTFDDLVASKETLIELLKVDVENTKAEEEITNAAAPFKQLIDMCSTFWNVMTRYLPRVTSMAQFSFDGYMKNIRQVFVNESLHSGTLTADQNTSLYNSLVQMTVQFVFSSMPLKECTLFLFISGFLMRINEGKAKKKDLDAILKHFQEEVDNTIDTSNIDPGNTDLIEHMKFTNVTNVFYFINAFVEEVFPDYLSYITHFQVDSIISQVSTIPSVVYAPACVDPTLMLHQFISLRSRNEAFDSYSLSDDPDLIKNTRKSLQMSITRGTLVLLHYSKPSRVVSNMLVDIYNQMSTTSVNTNFRLVLLCSTLDKLSPTMLRRSKRVNVESYPSVKHTMLQFFHHNGANVRATTSQSAIKKLSYASALLMSLMNFRSSISPIGLNTKDRCNDTMFKDIIEWFRVVIEKNPNDIPIRNIRNQMIDFIFANVYDEFDLMRLRDHANQIFVPETFNDGFTIARNAKDCDNWEIISDVPLQEFPNHIKKLPIRPDPEVLKMDADTSTPLMNWNYSRWVMSVFVQIAPSQSAIAASSGLTKLESFQMLIPESIPLGEMSNYESIKGRLLLNEILSVNEMISFMKLKVQDALDLAKSHGVGACKAALDFARGMLPEEWRHEAHIPTFAHTNKFISDLIERHAYILKWYKEGLPQEIDVSKINDLKSLLNCFLMEGVDAKGMSLSSAQLNFTLVDDKYQPNKNEIVLRKLWMINGGIKGNTLSVSNKDTHKTFLLVPGLCVSVERKVPENEKNYNCPIYKQALIPELNSEFSGEITFEAESTNLIWCTNLPTDRPPREWLFAGTSMVTKVPEQFI